VKTWTKPTSRTYVVLLDALNRHRGKGEQKVTVEHVHVHSGSQAVVGMVGAPGGGVARNWRINRINPMQIALSAASWRDPVLAVMANAAGALVPALYVPTMMTAVYNQAKGSPCALRFHIAAEGGWDVGAASGCMVAAVLLWAGAPISLGIRCLCSGPRRHRFSLARTDGPQVVSRTADRGAWKRGGVAACGAGAGRRIEYGTSAR
jgi:hypothetical protein